MRMLAVLIAATGLAWPTTLRAGTPKTSAAHAEAAQAEAMRKQVQHQQQLYQQEMHRQQEMEKRMVHQQQEAYKQQMKAVQQEQQRQAKAQQQASAHQAAKPTVAKVSTNGETATASTVVPVASNGSTAHHGTGYRVYRHGNNRSYRHHTQWPSQGDPETVALHRLKAALDGVARGTTTNSRHTGTLATALGNVVEVDRPPSVAAVRALAGHLASGMTHRESVSVNTGTLALTLRGVMNSTILDRNDLNSVMDQHKAALRSAKFQPGDVTAIETALHTIATQERARR